MASWVRSSGLDRGAIKGWQLAESVGDAWPWRTQRVLSQARWDQDAARDLCRAYTIEHLGDPDGVLVIDETGFVKKGTQSVGVARQYSGTAGRVENCQIGVFLAYASRHGHALIDRALYLPEDWSRDPERRATAAIPEAVTFATKPALALRMIERALAAGVPCSWVLGDEIYGSDRRLRMALEQRGQPFVLAVRGNEKLWSWLDGGMGQHAAAALAAAVPEAGWQRLSAGAGSKGERLYDWARLRLVRLQDERGSVHPWDHRLLIRRNRKNPEDLAYYVVFGPAATSLATLARVAGRRWTIEECFEAAKQETGLDGYEIRSGAPLPTARLASTHHPGDAGPGLPSGAAGEASAAKGGAFPSRLAGLVPLSVPELRRLIARLRQALRPPDRRLIFGWSFWRRAHQAVAQVCHCKRHAAEMQL